MKKKTKEYYKVNYWNPLTYIWTLLLIPIAFIFCSFVEQTFQDTILSHFEYLKRGGLNHARPLVIKLGMVRKVKE